MDEIAQNPIQKIMADSIRLSPPFKDGTFNMRQWIWKWVPGYSMSLPQSQPGTNAHRLGIHSVYFSKDFLTDDLDMSFKYGLPLEVFIDDPLTKKRVKYQRIENSRYYEYENVENPRLRIEVKESDFKTFMRTKISTIEIKLFSGKTHKIELTIPAEEYTSYPEEELLAAIHETFSKLPELGIQNLKKLKIISLINPSLAGFMMSQTNTVYIFLGGVENLDVFKEILLHEQGHIISKFIWRNQADPDKIWANAMKKDGNFISEYTKTNNGEDFAETVAEYLNTNGGETAPELRKLHIHRFQLLDHLFSDEKLRDEAFLSHIRNYYFIKNGVPTFFIRAGMIYFGIQILDLIINKTVHKIKENRDNPKEPTSN